MNIANKNKVQTYNEIKALFKIALTTAEKYFNFDILSIDCSRPGNGLTGVNKPYNVLRFVLDFEDFI